MQYRLIRRRVTSFFSETLPEAIAAAAAEDLFAYDLVGVTARSSNPIRVRPL
ncbi:MAG TPA: hypothetical protein VE398_21565 [Acidobacteriota bacterium]|nr:hypothetical protein [Acidobacteriota bacterium]